MRLLSNWWEVLKHAWSVRLMLLAALLSGLEVALPFMEITAIPTGWLAALSFAVTALAFVARFVVQSRLSGGSK